MHAEHTDADAASVEVMESASGNWLLVRWWADEPDVFAEVLASFRAAFATHGCAQWLAEQRCWSLPLCERARLEQWVQSCFTHESITWTAHTTTRTRTRTGRHSKSSGVTRNLDLDIDPAVRAAFDALYVVPSAPPEVVAAAHRALVRLVHPDHGGSHEQAVAVNEAIRIVREHQAQAHAQPRPQAQRH